MNNEIFENILKTINTSESFPWFAYEKANHNSKFGDYHFMHHLIFEGKIMSNHKFIIDEISKNIARYYRKNILVVRARINLFTLQGNQNGLGFHKDIEDSNGFKTLILYLENSNGMTEFKNGKKIKSVKNRALVFDSHLEHQTIMQTDVTFRKNININFKVENE